MIVKVRHSANTGNTPVALTDGELALNAVDQLLYYKHANGAVVILANGASILAFAAAQLSSNQNQIPANTSAYAITFNSNDILVGMAHVVGNSRVVALSNGWYEVAATGNFSRISGGGTLRIVDCWIRKNNVGVSGTTVRTPIAAVSTDYPMNVKTIVRLNTNDYIELMQAVDSVTGSTGLRSVVGLDGAPAIPSATLSMTKIAN